MEKKKNIKKERAKKYEEKLKINTTLDDVLNASVPKKKRNTPFLGVDQGLYFLIQF